MSNIHLMLGSFALFSSLSGMSNPVIADTFSWPLEKASESSWPSLKDNLDFERLDLAIDRQLAVMTDKTSSKQVDLDGRTITMGEIKEGLKAFRKLAVQARDCIVKATDASARNNCEVSFETQVKEKYDLYRPKLLATDDRFGKDDYAHFTAYYSPELMASEQAEGDYTYPIYMRPQTKELKNLSREEIDFDRKLDGLDLELGYANNLYDVYMLQVQGGGVLTFTNADGTVTHKYLSYDGGNGQKFSFLYKYMIDQGYITSGSIAQQRKYITENPDKQREIFGVCPNYVYFKFTEDEPLGVDDIVLTEGRSIAQDIGLYRAKGLISFVEGNLPEVQDDGKVKNKPFSRFFLDQDTGGAIKGKARADLYMGFGQKAETLAFNTNHFGKISYLIPKPVSVDVAQSNQ